MPSGPVDVALKRLPVALTLISRLVGTEAAPLPSKKTTIYDAKATFSLPKPIIVVLAGKAVDP